MHGVMALRTLTSVADIVAAFGGNAGLAMAYGLGLSSNRVSNWLRTGRVPAGRWRRLDSLLRRKGLVADLDLFTWDPPIKEIES